MAGVVKDRLKACPKRATPASLTRFSKEGRLSLRQNDRMNRKERPFFESGESCYPVRRKAARRKAALLDGAKQKKRPRLEIPRRRRPITSSAANAPSAIR
jgi:hypothetical protein